MRSPSQLALARSLRRNATEAERRLWQLLRGHRLGGLKFRRKVPLGGYIVDFVCFRAKLIVETYDGPAVGSTGIWERERHFAAEGFATIRYWSEDIMTDGERVAAEILNAARDRL